MSLKDLEKALSRVNKKSKNMTTDNFDENLRDYEKRNMTKKKKVVDLKCPVCKSNDKKHVVLSIMAETPTVGGRCRMREIAEYYVCKTCGVMYVDLNN